MSKMSSDFTSWLKAQKKNLEIAGSKDDSKDIQSAIKMLEYFDKHIKYPDVDSMTMQEIVNFLESSDPMTLPIEELDEVIRTAESIGCDALNCGMRAYARSDYLYGVRNARVMLSNTTPAEVKDGDAKAT